MAWVHDIQWWPVTNLPLLTWTYPSHTDLLAENNRQESHQFAKYAYDPPGQSFHWKSWSDYHVATTSNDTITNRDANREPGMDIDTDLDVQTILEQEHQHQVRQLRSRLSKLQLQLQQPKSKSQNQSWIDQLLRRSSPSLSPSPSRKQLAQANQKQQLQFTKQNRKLIPLGYSVNYTQQLVGCGSHKTFEAAVDMLQSAQALDLKWTKFVFMDNDKDKHKEKRSGKAHDTVPPCRMRNIMVVVRFWPFWVTNVSSLIYTHQQRNQIQLGWATTKRHMIAGEERLTLTFTPSHQNKASYCTCKSKPEHRIRSDHGDIHYEIASISFPRTPISLLAYTFTRQLQKMFARDSVQTMRAFLLLHQHEQQ